MKNKLLFFLLILFVFYLISQDATQTGATANEFFTWVDGGLDHARDFMDALLDKSDEVPEGATTP